MNVSAVTCAIDDESCHYHSMWHRLLGTTIFSLLSLAGIVGNLLVVTVVFRVKNMATPTNYYLVSLAIADCLFFVAAAPTELVGLHVPSNVNVFGDGVCALNTYAPYLAINASSLSITAFTVERYIGICHPMRARYMCTVKRARIIIVCIWVFSILYNSPWLYLAVYKNHATFPNRKSCTFRIGRDSWSYKIIFAGDFLGFYVMPMVLYVCVYGRIACTIVHRSATSTTNHALTATGDGTRRYSEPFRAVMATDAKRPKRPVKQNTLTGDEEGRRSANDVIVHLNGASYELDTKSGGCSSMSEGLSVPSKRASVATSVSSTTSAMKALIANRKRPKQAASICSLQRDSFVTGNAKATKHRGQVVKMLAVIVMVFAICWLPYRALVVYNSFAAVPWVNPIYVFVAKTMVFVNCAINPILYNLLSARFRSAFAQLLSASCRRCYHVDSGRPTASPSKLMESGHSRLRNEPTRAYRTLADESAWRSASAHCQPLNGTLKVRSPAHSFSGHRLTAPSQPQSTEQLARTN